MSQIGNVRHFAIRKFLALVLCLGCPAGARSQQTSAAVTTPSQAPPNESPPETSPGPAQHSSPDDSNAQLLQRITELEAEVNQLKQQQQAAPEKNETEPSPAPVESPKPETARLQLHAFGDAGLRANDRPHTVSNTFDIGSLDLFMTSRLSMTTSLLGELLFLSTNTTAEMKRVVSSSPGAIGFIRAIDFHGDGSDGGIKAVRVNGFLASDLGYKLRM